MAAVALLVEVLVRFGHTAAIIFETAMKTKDIHYKGVHPDSPFMMEQIDEFRSMLYCVASANNITAYPS